MKEEIKEAAEEEVVAAEGATNSVTNILFMPHLVAAFFILNKKTTNIDSGNGFLMVN